MANRAQVQGPKMLPMLVIILVLTVLVSAQVYAQVNDPELQQQVCVKKFGEGASAINDTDNLDCRLPNGTVVEDVAINLSSSGVSAG